MRNPCPSVCAPDAENPVAAVTRRAVRKFAVKIQPVRAIAIGVVNAAMMVESTMLDAIAPFIVLN